MSETNGEKQVLGDETPEADAIEQRTELTDEETEAGSQWPRQVPLDADAADVADQERVVEGDEDDYR